MAGGSFQTIDVSACSRSIAKLHQLVVQGHGRIHIKRRGCEDICVLISHSELESLERALEILSQTNEFQQMSGHITQVATETTGTIIASSAV